MACTVRDSAYIAPIGTHHIELMHAGSVGYESDPGTVGGPNWVARVGTKDGERAPIAAIGIDDDNLSVINVWAAAEYDARTVGGVTWRIIVATAR